MSGRGSLAISTGTGVFLSYARRDDESFSEFLASQLRSRGLVVWRDREAMASRGRSFRQEIREAINASERLVLVVGPQAARSRQVRAEWRQAYESCKVVVPILRLGDKSLIPHEFAELHFVDARAPRSPQDIVAELARVLGDPIQPLGALFGVDKPPEHLVPRPEELDRLKASVLADLAGPVVITSSHQTVALQGMGGLGKSVLAAVFARSCPVRRAFGDGVIWVRVGQQGDVVAALRLVGQALGDHDPSGYLDVAAGKERLMELLADRVCLLVLDDLWDVTHAEAFRDALGERCRVLITTRDGTLVSALGATEQRLDLLSAEQARTLLASWAGRNPSALPPQALQVLEECGNLPFAIALSGAMARDGVPWMDLLEALREADLAFLEQRLPNYPYPDVLRSLQASIDTLRRRDPAAARRYLELGVFPAGAAVPEAAVIVLWQRADDLSDRDARALLARLERNALLRLEGIAPNRTVTLHDLQYDYLTTTFMRSPGTRPVSRSSCSSPIVAIVPTDGPVAPTTATSSSDFPITCWRPGGLASCTSFCSTSTGSGPSLPRRGRLPRSPTLISCPTTSSYGWCGTRCGCRPTCSPETPNNSPASYPAAYQPTRAPPSRQCLCGQERASTAPGCGRYAPAWPPPAGRWHARSKATEA
jgi:hypothetical protein